MPRQVYEKKVTSLANYNLEGRSGSTNSPRPNALANQPATMRLTQPLRVPRVSIQVRSARKEREAALHRRPYAFRPPACILQVLNTEVLLAARCKRVFANAHTYHINSISVNSDQETFLSADDLRINLWNLEITEQSFNMVDIKPTNMEDLTEVGSGRAQHARTHFRALAPRHAD